MLDMLEKLINEHGSSAIQKERLLLISEKYSALEEVNSQLKARISELESLLEKESEKVEVLGNEVSSYKRDQGIIKLGKESKSILKFYFENESNIDISSVARRFGLDESQVHYYIDILKNKDLLENGPIHVNSPIVYHISQKGRAYVMEQLDRKDMPE